MTSEPALGSCEAMVLAAGFGTRLRPLTNELPKALVPWGDTTPLAAVLGRLARAGVGPAVVNSHYMGELFIKEIERLGAKVHLSHEAEILGTAGGVAKARPWLASAVLVHNVDIVCELPAADLLEAARADAMCLLVRPRAAGEGSVGLDARGHVVRLRGERFGQEQGGADYVGVMALARPVLDSVPPQGCLIGDVALPLLRSGGRIVTRAIEEDWLDLGSLEDYFEGNLRWLHQAVGGEASYLGPDVQVESGVQVEQSVIGAGARVVGAGLVRRCVAWPGSTIEAPLSDAVVTSEGQVVRVASGS